MTAHQQSVVASFMTEVRRTYPKKVADTCYRLLTDEKSSTYLNPQFALQTARRTHFGEFEKAIAESGKWRCVT